MRLVVVDVAGGFPMADVNGLDGFPTAARVVFVACPFVFLVAPPTVELDLTEAAVLGVVGD